MAFSDSHDTTGFSEDHDVKRPRWNPAAVFDLFQKKGASSDEFQSSPVLPGAPPAFGVSKSTTCTACNVEFSSHSTIFMAHDAPYCSERCRMHGVMRR
uniref:Uncharacterized protein n=1 Tax=Haptolina ericina TaxID=156174 RepID=A0A7S3ADN6_9EUKA